MAVTLSWWVVPVVWLVMELLVRSMGHVLHPRPPHLLLPGSCLVSGFMSALTRRSLRFLGRRYVMRGGSVMALLNQSERWRMWWVFLCDVAKRCLSRVVGGNQWCPLFLHLHLQSQCFFPVMVVTLLICSSSCSCLYPLWKRCCFSSPILFWKVSSVEQILLRHRAKL